MTSCPGGLCNFATRRLSLGHRRFRLLTASLAGSQPFGGDAGNWCRRSISGYLLPYEIASPCLQGGGVSKKRRQDSIPARSQLVLVSTLAGIRLMIFTNLVGLPHLPGYLPDLSYRRASSQSELADFSIASFFRHAASLFTLVGRRNLKVAEGSSRLF